MVAATKLQGEVRRRVNRVASEFNENLSAAEIDSYLNEALEIWFESRLVLAETTSRVRNELRQLEVKKECLDCKSIDTTCCKMIYPKGFHKLLRAEVVAVKDPCGEKRLKTLMFRTNDLDEGIRDPLWKSSYEYEEVIVDEGGDGLFIFRDDFSVKEVCIDFYRKPLAIATPSLYEESFYINWAGEKITSDVGLEIDSTYAYRNIVDIASLIILRDAGHTQDYQTQLDKILRIDKLS